MRRFILVGLLAASCASPYGQKVTILLSDETVDCVTPNGETKAYATLELDQPEDFYQSEVVSQVDGTAYLLPATRDGTTVTYECPTGFASLIVRHATVLQAKRDGATSAPSGSNAP